MKIIIPQIPISQIRMRFSSRGGFGKVYDPRAKEKNALKHFFKKQQKETFEHPRVTFVFHMPIPKSIRKSLVPLYNSGLLKHEKKPDVDNLIKLYLDCLDGIFFDGDQKVTLGAPIKVYHREPKVIIYISEMTDHLVQSEVDLEVWQDLYASECGK